MFLLVETASATPREICVFHNHEDPLGAYFLEICCESLSLEKIF